MKHPAEYISRHLLVFVSLSFIGGLALSPPLGELDVPTSFLPAVLLCFLVVLAGLHLFKKPRLVLCLLLPMVLGLGCYHGLLRRQLPADSRHIFNRIDTKKDVVLIGIMTKMAEFDGRTSQVTLETKSIRSKEDANLLPTTGKVLLRLQGPWPDQFLPGDTLAIRTELKRPDGFRTPGTFDYARYLAERDIWITGFVQSPLFIFRVEEPRSLLRTLGYLPERLRTTVGRQLDAAVPGELGGVYRAILIGDSSHIADRTLEIFKGSGTMHILAISGLHLAVIGTLLYAGFFWLLSRSEKLLLRVTVKKWAAFFSLPVLLGYALLAGLNTPVFRAAIMSSVVILAICTNRRKSPGALLAFAAMVILTIDPLQLFTASFQLSFAAITGILFLLPVLKVLFFPSTESASSASVPRKIASWLGAALLVSLVANLATAPIVIYTFNRFSTVGPLANLIIEPLICLWSLVAGFLAIPFIYIYPEICAFLLKTGAVGLDAAMHAAAFFNSLAGSTVWLPTPPLWLLAIYYVVLFVFACSNWNMKWRSLFALFTLTVFILLFWQPSWLKQTEDNDALRLSFLDVGQGSATLVEYPSNFRVLLDGGGSPFATTNVGERVIAPFLWHRGIRKIDVIAITHSDADHYNGLDFIISHFAPKVLWVRGLKGHDDDFRQLIQRAKNQGVAVVVPLEGQRLAEGAGALQCVANSSTWQQDLVPAIESRNMANDGLILKACSEQFCALFPGDIGRDTERLLVAKGYDVQADVLLAAHHGSITSNSAEFLAAVTPQYLLVSAGRSSKGYFPHKLLAQECQDRNIILKSTADEGTVEIIARRDGYRLYGFQKMSAANPFSSLRPVLLAEEGIRPR